jgi:hypothetical protein
VAALALIASGCGSVLAVDGTASRGTRGQVTGVRLPSVPRGSENAPAAAGDVAVIRGWADALRRGDVHAAALYFRIPSLFVDGSTSVEIDSLPDAEAANEALPCGARLISASLHGRYVNALFGLTGRPGPGGGSCGSGAGQTAHTLFLIRDGRILVWLLAPGTSQPPTSPHSPSPPGGTELI